MTPEQVSALSDAELNRAMIWLYPPANRPYDHFEDYGWRCCSGAYEDYIEYDYLTDYNQTMPLVKEHMITLSHYKNVTNACDFILGIEAFSMKSPLRAACECLVLIALDKNKPTTQTPPQID